MSTVTSCNWAPGGAGNSSGKRSWRKLRLILRQGRLISNILGAKAHVNVVKGTFSTDCKSSCVRIGLNTLKPPTTVTNNLDFFPSSADTQPCDGPPSRLYQVPGTIFGVDIGVTDVT